MSLWEAIVLGAVQGLSEFLPISSSGHLILIPWLFGWKDPGLAFDVFLHLGTALALIIYFLEIFGGCSLVVFPVCGKEELGLKSTDYYFGGS